MRAGVIKIVRLDLYGTPCTFCSFQISHYITILGQTLHKAITHVFLIAEFSSKSLLEEYGHAKVIHKVEFSSDGK